MKEQLELLPALGLAHLSLSLWALFLAALVSVPLGVWATRSAAVERLALGTASVIQTIPTLALLAIMVPLLTWVGAPAIGVVPALAGLVLYCTLPILLSTVTGIREVPASVIEAARSVGMTSRQQLILVELPLALPFIVAGLRTAAVWCVGMATLATPIGAKSLGNYIFAGLQTRNHDATLVGCVAAALLSLLLDGLIRLIESGVRRRRPARTRGGVIGLLALALVALIGPHVRADEATALRVGTKPFTEQFVLGHMLSADLTRAELGPVSVLESLGTTVAFDSVARGEVDLYVDYSGTLWTTVLLEPGPTPPREELLAQLRRELPKRYGVELVAALGFENTYCLALPRKEAQRLGVRKLSELALVSSSLSIGADYEFFSRAEYKALGATYGLRFREERAMDPALMYQAVAAGQVSLISAYSTDARIDSFDLLVLEDDRQVIPPYDAVLLMNAALAKRRPELVKKLSEWEGSLSAAAMRGLNRAVDEGGRTPRSVAHEWVDARSGER